MAVTTLVGKDVSIKIDTVNVGCATDISLDISAEMITTTCAASGGWKEQKPGEKSASGSLGGVMRVTTEGDIPTNITHAELFAKMVAGTACAIIFTATAGAGIGITYTCTAYISGLQIQAKPVGNGEATFTANIAVTGAVVVAAYD